MKSYTTAILFLCSVLIQKTAAQSPLETTILRIQEADPTALIGMATQRLSEANFQALANAVGTVFAALNSLALPDISQKLLNLDGSVKVLTQSASTLSTNIGLTEQKLNARIDALQLAVNPVIQELKAKVTTLDASVAQLIAKNCCSLVDALSAKFTKLELEMKVGDRDALAKIEALTRSLGGLSSTLQTTKSNLEMQLKSFSSLMSNLFKAVDQKIVVEGRLRGECCAKNGDDIKKLQDDLAALAQAEKDEEALEIERFKGVDAEIVRVEGRVDGIKGVQDTQNGRLDGLKTFVEKTYVDDQTAVNSRLDGLKTFVETTYPADEVLEDKRFKAIEAGLPQHVFTSAQTGPAHKVASFSFDGFTTTTVETRTFGGFDVTNSLTNPLKSQTYQIVIPTGTFENPPTVTASIQYIGPAPSNQAFPETLNVYATQITANSFNIVVITDAEALIAENYNVQAILYGN